MCNEIIQYIEKELPEICKVQDLIRVGIFRSAQSAYYSRKKKNHPPFFKLPGRGVIYSKTAILKWLKENQHENELNAEDFKKELIKELSRLFPNVNVEEKLGITKNNLNNQLAQLANEMRFQNV